MNRDNKMNYARNTILLLFLLLSVRERKISSLTLIPVVK